MSARSRDGDWVTSIEAGDEADPRGTIRSIALAAFRECSCDIIDDELLDIVNEVRARRNLPPVPVSSVSKRRGELCASGLVEPTDIRRASRWGREQVAWRATDVATG